MICKYNIRSPAKKLAGLSMPNLTDYVQHHTWTLLADTATNGKMKRLTAAATTELCDFSHEDCVPHAHIWRERILSPISRRRQDGSDYA